MEDLLRKLQLTELEILGVVNNICEKYGIKYSLYAGSLLGAIRHEGFIPWDDDLDICMSRDNYNKFLNVWELESPEGYFLQNKENSPDFTQSFSKIRKDHTTFYQKGENVGNRHMGIFVDIFPIDRMPDGWIKRKLFFWHCMIYQLYTREFVPTQNGKLKKAVSSIILCVSPRNYRLKKRKKLLKKITRYNRNHNNSMVAIEINSTLHTSLPCDLMDNFIPVKFEEKEFKSIKKWDEYLSIKYGDYLQYPPVEERTWAHPPIIIDFEHNYEDLPPEKRKITT